MNIIQDQKIRSLVVGTCIAIIAFIVIAGMHWMTEILSPFFISVLFAVLILPIVNLFRKKGISTNISIFISIILVIVFGLVLTGILGLATAEVSQKIPEYNERIIELYNSGLEYLATKGFDKTELEEIAILDPDKVFSFSISFLKGILSSFSNFILVILLTIFLLIEFVKIRIKMESIKFDEDSFYFKLHELYLDQQKYLSITAISGLIAAVADVILLLILGIDFAILIGFLSFLFNFIPNIGFFITIIPPAILALLKFGALKAIIVVVGFFIINTIVDNVIKPKFIGEEFNISILIVFLSLLFWGWVLGPIGAILSIPLTLTFKRLISILKDHKGLYEAYISAETATDNEVLEE